MRASWPTTRQTRHSPFFFEIALSKHALHERRRVWVQHRLRANSMACSLLHELYADVLHATKRIRPIEQGSQSYSYNSGRPFGFRCRLL